MRLLVCAATASELAAWGEGASDTKLLVSGVGVPATFAALAAPPDPLPDAVINIGIAGAYPGTGLEIGDVVIGTSEVYGDLGFALPDPPYFQPITQSAFGSFYADPFALWVPSGMGGHRGKGCTVGTCTGTQAQGLQRRDLFSAHFESMEGAALAQLGRQWGVPVCEVRTISNIAAQRDMRLVNIQQSLESLKAFLHSNRLFFHDIDNDPPHPPVPHV